MKVLKVALVVLFVAFVVMGVLYIAKDSERIMKQNEYHSTIR